MMGLDFSIALHIPGLYIYVALLLYSSNYSFIPACSCSSCLSSNNLCGWCLYDKKCASSSDQCRVSTDWINVSSTSIISVMS